MKAILIDSKQKTVTEVEVAEGNVLQDWYRHIGCTTVEAALYINEKEDCIMVDEEGLLMLTPDTPFFHLRRGPPAICRQRTNNRHRSRRRR